MIILDQKHKKFIIATLIVVVLMFVFILIRSSRKTVPPPEGQATTTPNATSTGVVPTNSDTTLTQYTDRNTPTTPSVKLPGCVLNFSFTPQKKTVTPLGVIDYSALIKNIGQNTCLNPSFSLYYGDNENFISASPKPTASTYWWRVPNLTSGAKYSVNIQTKNISTEENTVTNEGCATADNAKDACADNAIFIGTAPVTTTLKSTIVPQSLSSREFGMWIWDSVEQMSVDYEKNAVATMKANGFNTVYVTADDYITVANETDLTKKNAGIQKYYNDLKDFITLANASGIQVNIEGGANDWGKPENHWKGFTLIDLITNYNKANPNARIHGLQYDVESYLLPEYNNDKTKALLDFVTFIDQSAARMTENNAQFEVVIPHFYDDQVGWTPTFTYKGSTTYTFNHLLDVLAQKPDSAMVVLAYRNFLDGNNGSINLAKTEIDEAATSNTKIIVAQETGNVDPSYVTFHGMSKADLFAALKSITEQFSNSKSFGGTAVHYIDPFLELK